MKRVAPGWIVLLAMLAWTSQSFALSGAAVSGVVRDVHGTPQMGALVELLSGDATTVASAFTDDHGRYIMPSVLPGHYMLRATAAFFVPVTRSNLSLRAGAQAVINVTMSTLFEVGNWLPAERRAQGEPADDWKWTLRSTASRPLLRLVDPQTGEELSTSAPEIRRPVTQARLSVVQGDGKFGYGGVHQVLTMDRMVEGGDGSILRADMSDPQTPLAVAPSVDMLAGYERQTPLGGRTRLVASFASHPELMAAGVPGFTVLRLASAEDLSLGDAVLIDVGTLMEAERLEATRMMSEPYLRVTVRPDPNLAISYRYATGRELQASDDLDNLRPQTDVLTDANGRPLSDRGSHHELAVSRKLDQKDIVTVSIYHDGFDNAAIAGSGTVSNDAVQAVDIVSDPTTATFRLAAAGYDASGVNVSFSRALTPVLTALVEYSLGNALSASDSGDQLAGIATQRRKASAASVSLHGSILRSGTAINAEYRWQPLDTLTQVDAYDVTPDEGYLSFAVRQRIWGGRFLPRGMDAVVEATNLLEQGYQPVLAPDGHTLFLAQVPRAIQGGLAFNF